MAKRVVIDADECVGCESCVELCEEVFAFNEDEEKAEVIKPEGGPEDCIEEAMDSCPTECITWEEQTALFMKIFEQHLHIETTTKGYKEILISNKQIT